MGPAQARAALHPFTPFSSTSAICRGWHSFRSGLFCLLWRRHQLVVWNACPLCHSSKGFARQPPPRCALSSQPLPDLSFLHPPAPTFWCKETQRRRLSHSQKKRHFPRPLADKPQSHSTSKWSDPLLFCCSARPPPINSHVGPQSAH